jgi:hypothetical protein
MGKTWTKMSEHVPATLYSGNSICTGMLDELEQSLGRRMA